ncbi:HD-GYP domain-containing protein [Shewanella gaetbuli]|uniref:HD domain-containing protein n=1 Tax=Shewanella gaetbuli TaxID=220752 RepID=A0A9X2CM80_9GAMM|nr:HD domain-containing phosphohydrolase [Shewanella gaetbuli]MCL1143419.1 HD domain-containing protein [Shewanella gaetbuli]
MAKQELLQIPLSNLIIGLTVKLPLPWTKNPFFINKIKLEQQSQIEIIKGLDIDFVFVVSGHDLLPIIDEETSEPEKLEVAAEEVDFKALAKKSMRLSQKRSIKAINDSRNIFANVVSDPEGMYRESATLVEDLLAHLIETDNVYLSLVDHGEKDVSITSHGVSIAVLAMGIAHLNNMSKSEIRDIALGSILHDIGKLKVPDAIRRKQKDLTDHEVNFMKTHPSLGYELVSRSGLFPEPILDIILHHHEFNDGSGYPDGLREIKIPIATQIVSLANHYQALLHQYQSPQLALGVLFKRSEYHNEKLVSMLVKLLGIYPPGTLVKLSDEQIGKVMMTTSKVKKPHVWTCNVSGGKPRLRFLIDEDVEIVEVIKKETLTDGAIKTLQADNVINFYFNHFSK